MPPLKIKGLRDLLSAVAWPQQGFPAGLLGFVRRWASRQDWGQAMVETAIVFPVLLIFTLTVMETAMLMNAKQILNYAAFCAGRAGAVYGVDAEQQIHRAAALALSSISAPSGGQYTNGLIAAFNLPSTLTDDLPVPDGITAEEMKQRFLDAYARTEIGPEDPVICDGGSTIEVTLTYYARCGIMPMGFFAGTGEFVDYLVRPDRLAGKYPLLVSTGYLAELLATRNYTVPIRMRLKMDNWVSGM